MNQATDFAKNMRVRYTGSAMNRNFVPYAGQLATVIAPIKSRKVVHIRWDMEGEASFEAKPANLEIMLD